MFISRVGRLPIKNPGDGNLHNKARKRAGCVFILAPDMIGQMHQTTHFYKWTFIY